MTPCGCPLRNAVENGRPPSFGDQICLGAPDPLTLSLSRAQRGKTACPLRFLRQAQDERRGSKGADGYSRPAAPPLVFEMDENPPEILVVLLDPVIEAFDVRPGQESQDALLQLA
jgi:hypothetical protein